jgi:hypothetical protein
VTIALGFLLWPSPTVPARPSEPPLSAGTAGHSIKRGRVDLRELASRERARPLLAAESFEANEEPPRPWKRSVIPSDASLRLEQRRPVAETAGAPLLASPPLTSSFQALLQATSVFPPDVEGAVGPNHVVTMHNSEVRVQDRSGGHVLTVQFQSFWSKVAGDLSPFDPKLLYDPFLDRWIAAAVAGSFTKDASVLVGVSASGDPAGIWNLYRIDADGDDALWADYPCLGMNKSWIAVQVNMYPLNALDAEENFRRSQIYVFDKQNLVDGGADARHTLFTRDDLGTTQAPAVTYDPLETTLYLLEDWNGSAGGLGTLRLLSISGPVGQEVFRSIAFPATEATWDDFHVSGADVGPQVVTPFKISLDGADFSHVSLRNGLITAAHTIYLPAGAPTHTAVQWWQLTTDGSIVARGRLEDPAGQTFYGYPSIASNRNNDLLLGYSVFSAQQYASAGYSFRAAADASGTLRGGAVLKSGEDSYFQTGNGRNRWGDYSATVVDPAGGLDFWTIQEYAPKPPGSLVSRWATWWGRIAPDSGDPVALPVAGFTVPQSVVAGEPAALGDASVGAAQWFWNFGDGTTSSDRNPRHVFKVSGALTVTQTAVNQTGASVASRTIQVAPAPRSTPLPVSEPPRRPRAIAPRA